LKGIRATEFGDFWRVGSPSSAHERLGNAWWAWLVWVLTLEETAECIGQSYSHIQARSGGVVMPLTLCVRAMLLGYAIECALKGLWVKGGNKIVAGGKYIGVTGAKDHDLAQLAKAVGFSLTVAESDVLQRLSKFVRFAGRYPVARTSDEMRPHAVSVIGKVDVGFFSKHDFRIAKSALNKIICRISGKKRRVRLL
jgi:hypothetical protein